MKPAFSYLLFGIGLTTMVACGPPEKPKPPIQGNLEYVRTVPLAFQPVTLTRTASIAGERCYYDAAGTDKDHQFVFDDARDKVIVTINDTEGVKPGRSYSHRLFFKRPDGTAKASYTLEVSNPFSAPKPQFIFTFELAHSAADGKWRIEDQLPLGGFYELGQSDRDLAVDLSFTLRTDIPYSGVCKEYD